MRCVAQVVSKEPCAHRGLTKLSTNMHFRETFPLLGAAAITSRCTWKAIGDAVDDFAKMVH